MKVLDIVILAAGHGKRMHSSLPKVLHTLAGKPLLQYTIETAQQLDPADIYVVYGNGGDQVSKSLNSLPVQWVKQEQLLGTGHAVAQAISKIEREDSCVLILLADTPLISLNSLKNLIHSTKEHQVGLITFTTSDPFGLGRILRDEYGRVCRIVEERDATVEQKKIEEVNSGIFYVSLKLLKYWLPQLKNLNAQGEYYLTDIVSIAVKENIEIVTEVSVYENEMLGVNDRVQLARLERYYQKVAAKELMLTGVTLRDPNRFDLRGELVAGEDVIIDVNVILEGKNSIGANSLIGPHTILKNVTIGKGVEVKAYSFIEDATIGDYCIIGPFARIRPNTRLEKDVRIGNFVEVKNSQIDHGTKINHLSYIGDASIGKKVNIGAGTITCNYDGAMKHDTTIEDDVFIGSNTALVAPIQVKKGASIGAGSILSRNVPAGKLTLNRAKVKSVDWKRPLKRND